MWLVEHGVAAERVRSEGYGAERMIDTAGTEEARRRNRRVEFHVLADGATPVGPSP